MDGELRTRVNAPVILINREGLYVVIGVLGVSILGCAAVLTYSFTNYAKLKRNAEEVRGYIALRTKAAHQPSDDKQASAVVGGVTSVDDHSPSVNPAMLPDVRSDHMEKTRQEMSSGTTKGRNADDTFTVAERQEAAAVSRVGQGLVRPNSGPGGDVGNITVAPMRRFTWSL
ncbi:hypothetical protein HPB50_009321 [Hyalomma asiaticum]|uniref:Uncharacterized protein n=1 Tax=Hyalomma asiaticum TaxID=266040 RepID=A0ACB7SSV3_HYAAI|nr:hypothetical protein HPB50_009321 [Hyalomma asiaticum]